MQLHHYAQSAGSSRQNVLSFGYNLFANPAKPPNCCTNCAVLRSFRNLNVLSWCTIVYFKKVAFSFHCLSVADINFSILWGEVNYPKFNPCKVCDKLHVWICSNSLVSRELFTLLPICHLCYIMYSICALFVLSSLTYI